MDNTDVPNIALGGSEGVWMINGPPSLEKNTNFQGTDVKTMKTMAFSDDGKVFAYCDGRKVTVVDTDTWKEVFTVPRPRTFAMQFSPKSSVLSLWQNYIVTKDIPANSPNTQIYDVKTGKLLTEFVHKSNDTWNLQWLENETLCARIVSNEVVFYENKDFSKIADKCHLNKVSSFKLAHNHSNFLTYVPSVKAKPCSVQLYKYKYFDTPCASKSFYKADKVDSLWNSKDSAVLVLSTLESSSESYYGEQGLYFMDIKGETNRITLDKNGPIYSMKWHPNASEFCIVYGYIPSRATMFNMKCDEIFSFGSGPHNLCEFNPQGNILCIAGFGNLPGKMEFWDFKKKEKINTSTATNSTKFEWSRDGEHVLTATTAPRLRIDNGYKIWHYSGALRGERKLPADHELWMVNWQPGTMAPAPTISSTLPQGTSRPATDSKITKAYVPPQVRGLSAAQRSTVRIKENYEPPSNASKDSEKLSKVALKNKKKRENKAKAKEAVTVDQEDKVQQVTSERVFTNPESSGNLEKDKKIRNLKKKIDQIEKLIQKKANGESLEKNQLEKIEKLGELKNELSNL